MKTNKIIIKIIVLTLILTSLISINVTAYAPHFFHTGIHYYSHPNDINDLIWENISYSLCNNSNVNPSIAGNCTQVYFYNSTTGEWLKWDKNTPDSANNLTKARAYFGYLVNVTKTGDMNDIPAGLTLDPISGNPAWGWMEPGWNMMGWMTGKVTMNISDAIPLIYGNWSKNITRVWGYETGTIDDGNWSYDSNNLDYMKPFWPENPNSKFEEFEHAYWVCVENDSNRGYCERSEPPLMPWQNQRPTLYNGSVNNTNAKTTDDLKFTVYYSDPEGDNPNPINVVIDNVSYAMNPVTTSYSTGALITTSSDSLTPANKNGNTILSTSDPKSSGDHYFYFKASDGLNHTYYDGTNTTKYPKIPYDTMLTYHVNYLPNPVIQTNITGSVKVNRNILFNASKSNDTDGNITSYFWNFGDGTNSTNPETTHEYTSVGNYTVTLTVTDNMNETNTTTININVIPNPLPTANAGPNTIIKVNQTITLNGSGTDDEQITLYEWDFNGDGIYDWSSTTTGVTSHTYTTTGNYTAVLRVTDNDGATTTDTTTIKVVPNQPPVAVISYKHLYGLTYEFNALQSYDPDGTITKVLWNFGDGTTSTKWSVVHFFEIPRDYTIRLVVWDDNNAESIKITTLKMSDKIINIKTHDFTSSNCGANIPVDDCILLNLRNRSSNPVGIQPMKEEKINNFNKKEKEINKKLLTKKITIKQTRINNNKKTVLKETKKTTQAVAKTKTIKTTKAKTIKRIKQIK